MGMITIRSIAEAQRAALEEYQGDFSCYLPGGGTGTFLVCEFLLIKPEFYDWFKRGISVEGAA